MLQKLKGHNNVVYAVSFNLPYSDKVATGSFDKTAKIWNVSNGQLLSTYEGHEAEVVCLSFDQSSKRFCTGSMDNTSIIWDIETDKILYNLNEHQGEVISVSYNTEGDKILTGSFDYTAKIWDTYNGEVIYDLKEHEGEITTCQFNFSGNLVVTSSVDKNFVAYRRNDYLIESYEHTYQDYRIGQPYGETISGENYGGVSGKAANDGYYDLDNGKLVWKESITGLNKDGMWYYKDGVFISKGYDHNLQYNVKFHIEGVEDGSGSGPLSKTFVQQINYYPQYGANAYECIISHNGYKYTYDQVLSNDADAEATPEEIGNLC